MRRLVIALVSVIFVSGLAAPARADWRWKRPHWHLGTIKPWCDSPQCLNAARSRAKARLRHRYYLLDKKRRKEWKYWTRLYIPDCTWYGESGRGPKYARYRYTMPNTTGSGAYGKFQFMPHTYFTRGKYDDWSPLDQEIAVRREFWVHGEAPWTNCH